MSDIAIQIENLGKRYRDGDLTKHTHIAISRQNLRPRLARQRLGDGGINPITLIESQESRFFLHPRSVESVVTAGLNDGPPRDT